jgi:hypothetical protein
MSNKETFDRVRQGVLSMIDAHQNEIMEGRLHLWRIVGKYLQNDLRLSWEQEEKSQSVNGKREDSYLQR